MCMKRLYTAIWSVALILMMTSCTPATPAMTESGTALPTGAEPDRLSSAEPVTLTLSSTLQHTNADSAYPAWAEDAISRRIADMTGVQLVLELGNETESTHFDAGGMLQVMLSSGDLSDLIFVRQQKDIDRLSDSAYSQPLDVLAAEHCPEFWDSLDPLEILNNQREDGHVYALPKGYYTQQVYDDPQIPIEVPRTLYLRRDLLQRLGREMPASVEELESLLYQVKDQAQSLGIQYPLRQINAVSSPLAEWMGVKRYVYWDAEARSVKTPLRQDAWLPYFLRMNQWYRDGVLALPDVEAPWRSGSDESLGPVIDYFEETTAYSFATAADEILPAASSMYVLDEDPTTPFAHAYVTAPLTYEGEVRLQAADTAIGGQGDQGALFISTSCVRADRAICFMQYLKSQEGAQLTHWGVQDEHYTLDEDGFVTFTADYAYPQQMVDDMGFMSSVKKAGVDYWTLMDNSLVTGRLNASPTAYCTNPDLLEIRKMKIEAGVNYKAYAAQNKVPALYFAEPHEGDADYDEYLALLDTWHHAAWEMVTAPSSQQVESLWAQLMQDLSTAGLDAMESAMTARFADALERYHAAGYFTDIQP